MFLLGKKSGSWTQQQTHITGGLQSSPSQCFTILLCLLQGEYTLLDFTEIKAEQHKDIVSWKHHVHCMCLFLRACFNELQDNYTILWIVLDYTSDAIYYTDCFVKSRTGDKSSHTTQRCIETHSLPIHICSEQHNTFTVHKDIPFRGNESTS